MIVSLVLQAAGLRVERLAGLSVAAEVALAEGRARLSVTGEGGDQLFGSDKMAQCFCPAVVRRHDLPLQ